MANVKFTGLPTATTPLDGTEITAVVQSATSKQTTLDAVKTYITTNSTIAMATVTQMGLTAVIF